MSSVSLTWRQRVSLFARAAAGSIADSPTGRMLGGILPAGGATPARATADYLKSYSTMPWLRAVAARISYDVAATDWCVYVPRRDGKAYRNRHLQRAKHARRALLAKAQRSGELEELTDHPLVALLDDFNPFQTGLMGRKVMQLHLDLVGEAFLLIERGSLGQPIALWPVPPHWVTRTATPPTPFFEVRFGAYVEQVPTRDVVWLADVDPLNPYGRGSGTSQALADELETDEYTAKHIKSFYFNRARPDLVVWPKGDRGLVPEEVERLEEQWINRSGGFWRAFRPFFLRREVEIKELGQSFQNQQLVELREFERNTILHTFGVSPETLGIVSAGSNRATVTMGDVIYSKRVLLPRLELVRSVLQERLVPQFDERLILDYISPVTRDRELELDAAKAAPWAPTVDEWRDMQGLDALEDARAGAAHLGPMTVGPVAFTPMEIGDSPDGRLPVPDADAPDDDDDAYMDDVEAVATTVRKAADDPPAVQLGERQVGPYRRAQEYAWQALSNAPATTTLLAAVQANDPERVINAFGGMKAFRDALEQPLLDRGRAAFLRGADLAIQTLPTQTRAPFAVSLTDFNPEAVQWAKLRAAALVQGIHEDTRDKIRRLIARAHARGITPQETARQIRRMVGLTGRQWDAVSNLIDRVTEQGLRRAAAQNGGRYVPARVDPVTGREIAAHFDPPSAEPTPAQLRAIQQQVQRQSQKYVAGLSRQRAMLIARTEIMASTNAGQQAVWQLAARQGVIPASVERQWIVTLDDALDAKICLPLTDARAKLNEPFQPGGFMQPPAHPGCRCTIGLVAAPRRAADGDTRKSVAEALAHGPVND